MISVKCVFYDFISWLLTQSYWFNKRLNLKPMKNVLYLWKLSLWQLIFQNYVII